MRCSAQYESPPVEFISFAKKVAIYFCYFLLSYSVRMLFSLRLWNRSPGGKSAELPSMKDFEYDPCVQKIMAETTNLTQGIEVKPVTQIQVKDSLESLNINKATSCDGFVYTVCWLFVTWPLSRGYFGSWDKFLRHCHCGGVAAVNQLIKIRVSVWTVCWEQIFHCREVAGRYN